MLLQKNNVVPDTPTSARKPLPSLYAAIALLLALSLLPAFTPILAADQPGSQPGGVNTATPTMESLRARISEFEPTAAQDGQESRKLENYRQTLAYLQNADKEQQQTLQLKQIVDNAKPQLDELRKKLDQASGLSAPPPLSPTLQEEELSRLLNQAQSERQLAQASLQELENSQATLRLRPEQTGIELAQAKRELEALDDRLLSAGATGMPDHQTELLRANQQLLKSRVSRFEMERLSHPHQMEQLAIQIRLASISLERREARVQQLLERLSLTQAKEAARAELEAQKAQQKAAGKHPLIRQYANENTEISRKLSTMTEAAEQAASQVEAVRERKVSLRQGQERAQQQIIIGGLDEKPGQLLQTQRSALPKPENLIKEVEQRRSRIASLRLESLQIHDLRQQLQVELERNWISGFRPADLSESDWAELRPELRQLLENRLLLLDKINATYSRYEKALADLNAEQLQLRDRAEQYGALLDRHLLWIPSTRSIDTQTLRHAAAAIDWFLSPENWRSAADGIFTGLQKHPYRVTLLLILMVVLLYSRPGMQRTLSRMAPSVGNVSQDSFLHTVKAFAITLLLALPWPLLTAALGWWLTKGSDQPFVNAMSLGLRRLALFFFIIQIIRYLFIKDGLAEVHFRWNPDGGRLYRRHLRWLVPVLIPLAFAVGVFEWIDEQAFTNSLGRLAFIAALFSVGIFFHRVLNPWSGFMANGGNNRPFTFNRLWYPAAMVASVLLIGLAYEGYYYSALSLERMLFASIFAGLLVFLLYNLLVRWLLVAERRLALARARARRQAALEARATKEAADAAGEGLPELSDIEEVNLATINEQTRRMLQVVSGLLLAALLYLIWEQLTPALGWLNEMTLWRYESDTGEAAFITLWDGLLTLLVLGLTLIAGRNLPGLLEITLLQPLDLALGNRYAVSTISRYTIYAVGSLTVLNLLGLRWDDVQWLIAAMGVGLGFGLKEIFANFFSGIMILFERPIRVGDTVTIGDISGTVSRIRIRATTITDWDNKELVVPNKNFITDPLINWTLTDPITRIVIKVGIAYGSDTELAHRTMTEVVKGHPDVMVDPRPTIFFTGFGDSALNFDIRVFVKDHLLRMPLIHDLHMALNKSLADAGIEIPFPQRDLHLRSVDPGINLGPRP